MKDTIECSCFQWRLLTHNKWPVLYNLLLFACHLFDIFVQDISTIAGGGGGGYVGVQVTGDNRKSFLSLKFSIPG